MRMASLRTQSSIFSVDSAPYGTSFSKWTVRWWEWLLKIPKNLNPAFDVTGARCSESQYDPRVWFLAGTFGGAAVRRCTVPFGRGILFPVINYEACFADEPLLTRKEDLEQKCEDEIDKIADLYLTVDGHHVDLSDYRIAAPCFDINLAMDNCISVRFGETCMASDGYWLFLKPPAKGEHVIRSFGSCLAGKVKIKCTYDLKIQ